MFKDLLHNLKNRFFGADSRWLDERAIAALTTAVKNGERGHGGELRLVIERRPLPGDTPLQTRAERHFSTLGLWNTEDRSAVLIYLNLAASQLYILADNGVLAVIPQNIWDDLAARMEALLNLAGGSAAYTGAYSGWKPQPHAELVEKLAALGEKIYGKMPPVKAIHAGLECGILSGKIKNLDAVSIGPDMKDIHTPEERLNIPSTKRVYDFVVKIIEHKSK